jgi:hypothetical protein
MSAVIQLSWDGRRLLMRGPHSTIIAYHIPNSSKAPPGKTLQLDPGPSESLLAATLDKHGWSWVTLKGDRIFSMVRIYAVKASSIALC